MGRMVEGRWTTQGYQADNKGRFLRSRTRFREWMSTDGSTPHAPEAGRYHLYVSYACPWAHRTLIVRALQGLEAAVPVTVVDPRMGSGGWELTEDDPDPILGARYLREVYAAADPAYTGRVTVPVLWDTQRETIVNNESREIIRMFDHAMTPFAEHPVDLAPPELRGEVEAVIDAIYQPINNGVYRCGFARTQEAYDEAFTELFDALDHWNAVLARQRWLCGDRLTEADVCMFTTLARFDLVYFTHFKCNLKNIYDYPHLWRFAKDLLAQPGVAGTCDWDHMKVHYYWSHESLNPKRLVPGGPERYLGNPCD